MTVGQSYRSLVTINVYDEDGDDTTMSLSPDTSENVTLDVNTGVLGWTNVGNINTAYVKVLITDGKVTVEWMPYIKLCNCQVMSRTLHRNKDLNSRQIICLIHIKCYLNDRTLYVYPHG